ncbi:MAG: isoprenylcysteine carboxylmethyltransferase family protein [Azoarcus sp.]|jgi:protein-S-isoprenylcysteine O-methyltransferase|nr:isoprenylcysteine carboxylmethyltransferase family protein [Azoarcus sp.]
MKIVKIGTLERCLAYMCVLAAALSLFAWENARGGQEDVMPTAIPWDMAQQKSLRDSLLGQPPASRTRLQWKQLAVLSVAIAGESPGGGEQVREAVEIVEAAARAHPDDAEIMAAGGSAMCMRAADKGISGAQAMNYARQGFRRLDEAVLRYEHELGARLQRAISSLRAPPFLNKTSTAREDFAFLLSRVPQGDEYRALRAMFQFYLGEAQAAAGEWEAARDAWRGVAPLNVPGWSSRAGERLRDAGEPERRADGSGTEEVYSPGPRRHRGGGMSTGFNVIFMILSLGWLASEIGFAQVRKSDEKTVTRRDRLSLLWINAAIYLSIPLAFVLTGKGIGRFSPAWQDLRWCGLVLIVVGLAVKWHAIAKLRSFFTVDVAIHPDHQLVRSGAYRYVRHPSYLGALIAFAGLGTGMGSWAAILAMLLPLAATFLWRIRVEEQALAEAFPEAYPEYKSSTWALIPFLY